MIKIPLQNQYSITNLSDKSGNIYYTKNVNFDEEGYIKQSSRSVAIASKDDLTNFGHVTSIGRSDLSGSAHIVTASVTDHAYEVTMSSGGLSVSGDNTTGGNRPVGSIYNRGVWWKNKWHVTGVDVSNSNNIDLYTNTAGTWAKVIAAGFTAAYPHPLEVFKTGDAICVGNANTVKRYDNTYSLTVTLTLPTDYTVIGLAFSGSEMGVATQTANTLPGQNQEAQFYKWDGLGTSSGTGYPVGSDAILAIKPYKSSWVILTRNGKLKYFNGGGFQTLATLPFFFKKYPIDSASMFADCITVEEDLIYINVPADIKYFGLKQERFMQNLNGGILCYDPKVGLYHRYSPSISKMVQIDVSSADTTNDILNCSSANVIPTGNPILYSGGNSIGGLTKGTVYYVIRHTSGTFSLATTKSNALDGMKVNITSSNNATFLGVTLTDYGASQSVYGTAVGLMGNQDYQYDHLMFGNYSYNTSLTAKEILCLTVPQFPNISYYVTAKSIAQSLEDVNQVIYIKNKPLKTNDVITVKYKDKDILGLPVTTPQLGLGFTVTSSTTLTTTADISEAYTYLNADTINQLELEITSGAGAGQLSQITSIAYNAGTYTVTLTDELDGVANGNACNVIIDNWKKLGTITSANNDKGWEEFAVATNSKWILYKVIMKGVGITIEETLANNEKHI